MSQRARSDGVMQSSPAAKYQPLASRATGRAGPSAYRVYATASVELDDERLHMLYVPIGFAHGFCVLSDVADELPF